jgi:hypothetical protein
MDDVKPAAPDRIPPVIALLAFAAVFLFSFLACGTMAYLLGIGAEETPPGNETRPPPVADETPGNGTETPPGLNVSGEDLETWEDITTSNVERACLEKAREEAGSSASLVYFCECTETDGELVKSYGCDIATADPFTDYFADITCTLETKMCTVVSNYGQANVSFAEIREYGLG